MGAVLDKHVYNTTSYNVTISTEDEEIGEIGFKSSKTIRFPSSLKKGAPLLFSTHISGFTVVIPLKWKKIIIHLTESNSLIVEELKDYHDISYIVNCDLFTKLESAHNEHKTKNFSTSNRDIESRCKSQNPNATLNLHTGLLRPEKGTSVQHISTGQNHIDMSEPIQHSSPKGRSTVKTAKSGVVSSSSIFGAASCAAVSAISGGIDEFRRQQLELKAILTRYLIDVSNGRISQRAADIICDFVGDIPADIRKLATRVSKDAAKGTVVGGVVGGAVATGMVGFSHGAAALDAANNVMAASVMRGVGTGLGVAVTTAITCAEIGRNLHLQKHDKLHHMSAKRRNLASSLKGVINAGICSMAFIPAIGIFMTIGAGVVFNVTDASTGWSDGVARRTYPVLGNELEFNAVLSEKNLIKISKECLQLDPKKEVTEEEVNRALRKWMRSLHPDKNLNQDNPNMYVITLAATILLNNIRNKPIAPYELMPMMEDYK